MKISGKSLLISCSIVAIIWIVLSFYLIFTKQTEGENFHAQTLVFACFALSSATVGFAVGFQNGKPRFAWVLADFLWTTIIILSIGKFLVPVENFLRDSKFEIAQNVAGSDRDFLMRKIWIAQSMHCSESSKAAIVCKALKEIENEASLATFDPAILSNVQRNIAILNGCYLPSTEYQGISDALDAYKRSYLAVRELKSGLTNFEFWYPYFLVGVVILVLGFRAGRTGAEHRRNLDVERAKKRVDKRNRAAGVDAKPEQKKFLTVAWTSFLFYIRNIARKA